MREVNPIRYNELAAFCSWALKVLAARTSLGLAHPPRQGGLLLADGYRPRRGLLTRGFNHHSRGRLRPATADWRPLELPQATMSRRRDR